MLKRSVVSLVWFATTCFAEAQGAGLDRDTLVTEAPATPDKSNLRVSGLTAVASGGAGGEDGDADGGSGDVAASVSATLMWTPFEYFAGDVGGYYQDGIVGPTARIRYQIISQDHQGLDLAVGVRLKIVGFNTRDNVDAPHEVEGLVAFGRRHGKLRWIFNTVVGAELDDPGRDAELKANVGWAVLPDLVVGLDGRVQAEFADETGTHAPDPGDVAFIAGPAVSYMLYEDLQLQGLVGVSKAAGELASVGATAQVFLAYDIFGQK